MTVPEIIAILALLYLGGYFLYLLYYAFDLYFKNPFVKLKKLSVSEERLVEENFWAYSKLLPRQKDRFKDRLIRFRRAKEFVFNGNIAYRENITLLLSATAVMLTLGMKEYRIKSIKRIVIYPSQYFSILKRQNHIGEYNPRLKTLVFSAEHVLEGFKIADDNRNLCVHEFAHALSFNAMGRKSFQNLVFMRGLKKIKNMFLDPHFVAKIERTSYFREYGKTNVHEFFAVAAENFVETPQEFLNDFPELYKVIKRMLNVDFL